MYIRTWSDYYLLNVTRVEPLTDLKQLRVHAVKVADEEKGNRPSGVEKQQIAGREIQDESSTMDHHQTDPLHREYHPNKTTHDSHFNIVMDKLISWLQTWTSKIPTTAIKQVFNLLKYQFDV